MRFGLGSWRAIIDSGCLPGKTRTQLCLQTQRMIGQQSLGEFMGLHIDTDAVWRDNQKKKNVIRKNGCIVNQGNNPTPEQRRQKIEENRVRYELPREKWERIELPDRRLEVRPSTAALQARLLQLRTRLEKLEAALEQRQKAAGLEVKPVSDPSEDRDPPNPLLERVVAAELRRLLLAAPRTAPHSSASGSGSSNNNKRKARNGGGSGGGKRRSGGIRAELEAELRDLVADRPKRKAAAASRLAVKAAGLLEADDEPILKMLPASDLEPAAPVTSLGEFSEQDPLNPDVDMDRDMALAYQLQYAEEASQLPLFSAASGRGKRAVPNGSAGGAGGSDEDPDFEENDFASRPKRRR